MMLILHIIFAIGSMLSVTGAYVLPSRFKFRLSAVLIGLTLASGTYLVLSLHAHLLQSCVTGLSYLAVVTVGMLLATRRFARQEAIVREVRQGVRFRK